MTNLQRLVKLAKEGKFPTSSLVKAAAFKHELEKTAAGSIPALSLVLQAGLLGAGIGMGHLAADYLGDVSIKRSKPRLLENVYSAHPSLRNEDPVVVNRYMDSLIHFSPEVAKDPLAAGGFITQALRMADLGGPPLSQFKDLTAITKDMRTSGKDRASIGVQVLDPAYEVAMQGFKERAKAKYSKNGNNHDG